MSIHDLSDLTGISAGHLSYLENGKRRPTLATARKIDAAFPNREGWFSDYVEDSEEWTPPNYRDWTQYELTASFLRAWVSGSIHGLVQTEDYARELLATFPGVPAEVRAARLRGRMERQRRVVYRDSPPEILVLVDEMALYREVGSPAIMAGQLDHLLSMAQLDHVTVQVVPAFGHPATATELIVTDQAAYAEHIASGSVYVEPDSVTSLGRLFTNMQGEALRVSETLQLAGRVRDTWALGENPLTAVRTGGRASKSG